MAKVGIQGSCSQDERAASAYEKIVKSYRAMTGNRQNDVKKLKSITGRLASIDYLHRGPELIKIANNTRQSISIRPKLFFQLSAMKITYFASVATPKENCDSACPDAGSCLSLMPDSDNSYRTKNFWRRPTTQSKKITPRSHANFPWVVD